MNKMLVATLGLLTALPTLAADTWPQPESAYHATQPRAQWLETAPRTGSTPAATPAVAQTMYGTPYPTAGYGGERFFPGYYGYGAPVQPRAYPYRPYRRHSSRWGSWPWRGSNWPSWNDMPSPSFSMPSFSFPTPGW